MRLIVCLGLFYVYFSSTVIYAQNIEIPRLLGSQIQPHQQTIKLNGEWQFKTDPVSGFLLDSRGVIKDNQTVEPGRLTPGFKAGYHLKEYNDKHWDTMPVPSNWDLYDRYSNYFNNAWYRRSFIWQETDEKVVNLNFDAVYYQAEVWLNGVLIGHHIGGYTPFSFEISEYLVEGENTLAVRVNNLFRQGAWWPWGGISRDVTITIDPNVYIAEQKIIASPDLADGFADIVSRAKIVNRSDKDQLIRLKGDVLTENGTLLASLETDSSSVMVPAKDEVDIQFKGKLAPSSYQLWHFDNPALYYNHLSIVNDTTEQLLYTRFDRFGIRKIELSGGKFKLNGEIVRLIGYNRISDNRVSGSTEPRYVVQSDLDKMKSAGANLTRIHHVVQAKHLIEYADEIGILLIGEIPLFGSEADISSGNIQTALELKEMIKRDFNHPSIFAWSVANEIPSTSDAAREFVKRMVDLSKELDPSRPVTYARKSAGGTTKNDAIQYVDFPSVNLYGGFTKATTKLSKLWPNKPIFVSEYSSDGYKFSIQRETLEHKTKVGEVIHQWNNHPQVLGASVWSFNDYRSQFRGTSINETRGWGIQDTWGNLKFSYKQAQNGFAPVANLAIEQTESINGYFNSQIKLQPRDIPERSIPSYTLNNYHLLWQVVDKNNHIIHGKIIELPQIKPSNKVYTFEIKEKMEPLQKSMIVAERVSLLTPTSHIVKTTQVNWKKPEKPVIKQIIQGKNSLRVFFDRDIDVNKYTARANNSGHSVEGIALQSNYIDLKGLESQQPYQISLVAENENGRVVSVEHSIYHDENQWALPPVVQVLRAVKNGFVLGFINSEIEAKQWTVEVVDSKTNTLVERYQTTTIGGTRNQRLSGNHQYKVRIRASHSNIWSPFKTVTTLGEEYTPQLKIYGVLNGLNAIAVSISPNYYATSYRLKVDSEDGISEVREIRSSSLNVLYVDKLKSNTRYSIEVKVVTSFGESKGVVFTTQTRH